MYLLDTCFCIDFMRGKEYARQAMARVKPSEVAISAVTLGEMFIGAYGATLPEKESDKVRAFAATVPVLPFGSMEAHTWGTIQALLRKTGQLIGDADAMIAATAAAHQLTVVTSNAKHMARVKDLKVTDWQEKLPRAKKRE